MSKKWIIAIVAFVIMGMVACAGLGALRWGEMIYRRSDGQRGWSLGATVYEALGWGSEAYRSDFGWDRVVPEGEAFGPGRIGRFGRHFGPFRAVGGLGRLAFLAALIGLGVFLWRRQCKVQTEQT